MKSATAHDPRQMDIFSGHEYPQNPFSYQSQAWRLYERLKVGPVTNTEIIYEMRIPNSTGRASDVRDFLAKEGYELVCGPAANGQGIYEYRIRKGGIDGI